MTIPGQTYRVNPREAILNAISAHRTRDATFMIGTRYVRSISPVEAEDEEPFALQVMPEDTVRGGSLGVIVESSRSLPNQIRLYVVNGETCAQDVQETLHLAKQVNYFHLSVVRFLYMCMYVRVRY